MQFVPRDVLDELAEQLVFVRVGGDQASPYQDVLSTANVGNQATLAGGEELQPIGLCREIRIEVLSVLEDKLFE
mgnify:CR=1 FL=1